MLYLVSTPIGNMKDITLRALEVLQRADEIWCEDTRVTGKLLNYHGIEGKKLVSLNAFKEKSVSDEFLLKAKEKDIAFVTDAGTPGISDPGALLVSRARELGVEVDAIPGPSAFVVALSLAGENVSRFCFFGFLPAKKGRAKFLQKIKDSEYPVVLYESVHRIEKLLSELEEILLESKIFLARELTKMHQQIIKGTPKEVKENLSKENKKGEFVVVVFKNK